MADSVATGRGAEAGAAGEALVVGQSQSCTVVLVSSGANGGSQVGWNFKMCGQLLQDTPYGQQNSEAVGEAVVLSLCSSQAHTFNELALPD